ncbi:amino acid/amide ABC transporter ATP-binding protein 2, HAAT family [Desulfosporosinus acidiphilus SJ4]|uniref:Amino acid/amide ABC transporter ATP-binding protein 2, HAAT family n=1 Tax=Desulfosporosinus acidiphilus (strain DSM 22704 / JCM 16185 / SJ4) TaxID=646529 RepID=I4D2J5_DESAJ|nr:ABC transporter ATP-binding protein [Desulfosporosinus acidiphilus]AFM40019.1 amino acid/amide ABC transporter ATP-binding protein 2, HAAT family [Desulfosporosinus acidiphilus SJ4]
MLEIKDIHSYYGMSHILFGLSLNVAQGEVVALLGRNGVGKTTTLKSIMGIVPPKSGQITFRGQNITKTPTNRLVKLGICYVPDSRRIFSDLSVRENLEIAAGIRTGSWTIDKVHDLFPVLKKYENRRGGNLSGGEQQMLSIARALLGNPDLLLLDEPTEGLAPLIVRELEGQISELCSTGMSILLAEQNLKSALKLANRCYILERGQVRFEGTVEALSENEEIRTKYLLV